MQARGIGIRLWCRRLTKSKWVLHIQLMRQRAESGRHQIQRHKRGRLRVPLQRCSQDIGNTQCFGEEKQWQHKITNKNFEKSKRAILLMVSAGVVKICQTTENSFRSSTAPITRPNIKKMIFSNRRKIHSSQHIFTTLNSHIYNQEATIRNNHVLQMFQNSCSHWDES